MNKKEKLKKCTVETHNHTWILPYSNFFFGGCGFHFSQFSILNSLCSLTILSQFSILCGFHFSLFSITHNRAISRSISLNSTARPISSPRTIFFSTWFVYFSHFLFCFFAYISSFNFDAHAYAFYFLGFASGKWYSGSAWFWCWRISRYVILL